MDYIISTKKKEEKKRILVHILHDQKENGNVELLHPKEEVNPS